jgi:ABC-type Mn2+/Zn2+ transport system ATPase subunit
MTPGALVQIDQVSVGYGGHRVVDDVSLTMGPGDLLVLMGTNGSGKSTLLKTLAGLLAPISGAVQVLGAAPGKRPSDVAYLPQHPGSLDTLPLRVRDVVSMGRFATRGLLGRMRADDRRIVTESLQRTGAHTFADRALRELSGGQQQRTHLAQVLARQAMVLLLDEPTAGLDANGRRAVTEAIDAERARGAAVVLATHDLADAEHADEVMLLAHGIVAQGAPGETLTDEHLRTCYGFTERH